MIGPVRRPALSVARLARRALRYEWGMWRSLFRWLVIRRPYGSTPHTAAFSYAGVVTPVLGAFIAVSAIEIPILHLVLPWATARLIADAAGVYGLFWMIGLLASLRVHPHLMDGAGLRVRNGFSVELTVPWSAVVTVRKRYRSLPSSRAIQVERAGAGTVLHVSTSSQTSIDVVLREPVSFALPRGGSDLITELRFYADDSDGLVAAARGHLAAVHDSTAERAP